MIWDEGLRTALHSVQRVFVLKLTADLRPVYKGISYDLILSVSTSLPSVHSSSLSVVCTELVD